MNSQNKSKTAILLSRQALRPTGNSEWVKQSNEVVQFINDKQLNLLSSIGMQSWEMLTSLASIHNIDLTLYLPYESLDQFEELKIKTIYQFDLDRSKTNFIAVKNGNQIDWRKERDKMIVEDAELLLPLSIRKNSSFSELVNKSSATIDSRFQINYEHGSTKISELYDVKNVIIKNALNDAYLIHWTRGISSNYYEEKLIDYYQEILLSDNWSRTGFNVLHRILSKHTISASSRHMPQNARTVSFTSLCPLDFIPMMKYRARYQEMSFEPYGIGIEKKRANDFSILPVNYYSKSKNSPEQNWLSQSNGSITDWRTEDEYRFLGDLSLNKIDQSAIALFCKSRDEAEILQKDFGYNTIPLFEK